VDFECFCGDTFLLSGHLWVIISSPNGEPGQVIIAFLTSKKMNSDTTVILLPDHHKFIKHPTVVSFADARIERTDFIRKRVEERDYEPRERFDEGAISVIQRGLIESPFTPRYIRSYFISLNQYNQP
jgi:hypothetical protein